MKAFAQLYTSLDETNKTNEKVEALVDYFRQAPPEDAIWAVFFLVGRKPRQVVPSRKLREWAVEMAGIPDWLLDECYHAVGDGAETIALLLPPPQTSEEKPLHWWIEKRLLPMRELDEKEQKEYLFEAWKSLTRQQRFAWNKLITGAFRVGVSQQLVTRALAKVSGVEAGVIAHRLMGNWDPVPEFFQELLSADSGDADISRPYPFFLAHPLEVSPNSLGSEDQWIAEWKWDGIRAQLIRRQGKTFLWTRGEELVTDSYPEVTDSGFAIPDGTVLDGELLPWKDDSVLPFSEMQRRIGRKKLGSKILQEVPVVLMVFDLLEWAGEDVREKPLQWRRGQLQELVLKNSALSAVKLSPLHSFSSWQELGELQLESRAHRVEGLMLKRLSSPYRVGRQRGDWWKWKVEPYTIDAVLIYAQRGSGKRASLYTDYTFGVWEEGQLVPVAKAYSGLTDEEIRQVDSFVRRNTIEKFGPVRTVKPELVFELAFEGIQLSSRHKSGIAVRFPRMLHWRKDKKAEEADSLATVRGMLPNYEK